jgi:EmrB/QacA subfamily drug resistance transporter
VEVTVDPQRWKALGVLGIAYLMVILDVSIVNVALPSIQEDLGFSTEGLQWVVSGYALTFGGLLLLGGRAGDLLGRRKVFTAGLLLFSTFSLLCGLAWSPGVLVAARMLQGAAGAVLSPSVFSITLVTFEEGADRNKALGILGAIAGSGAAIGVLLGGVLTEYAGWQWIFFVNVPIGLAAAALVRVFVRESRAPGLARHFDAAGAVTVTAGLMLLVYGLTEAPDSGWTSPKVVAALVGWAVLSAAFLFIEVRSPSPLVRLGIFRRRTLTAANAIGLILGTAVFGMFFLLSLYMQEVLGFSALETGVGYLAVALTAVAASGLSQALVTRVGVKWVLAAGMALLVGGLVYFTQISVGGSYVNDLLPGFILIGVGLGFSFVPISIAALAGVEGHEAGLASGLINTNQQIGGAIGLAILTTVSTSYMDSQIADGVSKIQATVDGFSLAFWVAAGISFVGLVITLLAFRRRELALQQQVEPAAPGVASTAPAPGVRD